MKAKILSIAIMLFSLSANAQKLSYSTIYNSTLRLTIDNNAVTIKNLTNHTVKVLMFNTVEDTVILSSGCSKNVTQKTGTKFVGAKDLSSSCNCWLQLVTDCTLMPIKISNVEYRQTGTNQIQFSFDAYNDKYDGLNTIYLMYQKDNETAWKVIKIDVPEVTGISQHYLKTVTIN